MFFSSGKNKSAKNTDGRVQELLTNKQQVIQLEKEVEHLRLITEAMWGVLKSFSGASDDVLDEEIQTLIEEKKSQKTKRLACKNCARIVSAAHRNCIYCGGKLKGYRSENVF